MATTASHSSVCIDSQKGVTDPVQAVPARRDRRVRNRFQCEGLTCTLGDVIGLSGSGMRVSARGWCRYKAHDRLSLTLTQFGAQLSLIARVAWVRRTGFFRYEAGMEFMHLTAEQNAALVSMAQMAMPRTTVRKGIVADIPTE